MLRDKSVPKRKKAVLIVGLILLFFPSLLFSPIGLAGKLIVWIWIIWYLREELDKYWLGEKPLDLSKTYRGKTVIHTVDYEIKDKGDKS